MNYYLNILLTIVILIAGTGLALFIDQFSKQLEKFIPSRYLSSTIIMILFTLMTGATAMTSSLGGWSLMDTAFISSLCFFAIGWLTNISKRAGINQASTAATFITNDQFKYVYVREEWFEWCREIDPVELLIAAGITTEKKK